MDIKIKAHIGDGLAATFARMLVNEAIGGKFEHYQSRHFVHSGRMVSNAHFAKVCRKFNLFNPHNDLTCFNDRPLGTKYEAYLYDLFVNNGFDEALDFFKQTAFNLYVELYEEMLALQ